ncbi:hypothetical protein [Thiomicrorhabdus lithotrophica]|uniref:Uncharacterized protein n=1 Tax=Thiomicrorhabdus lithotrophica TaxID=2949997 RepID=A0ABY8C798_9GAMM|nr:hypothetical protein [Thiomicrorhabdus lithotrophica]WEJ61840.1 hypothetical protein NR989_07405 [Thiomicrorhabdus lithotrophica]
MTSFLTEAELSILLMDNTKFQKTTDYQLEELFMIGQTPIYSLINQVNFTFTNNVTIPLCQDLLTYLDVQVSATGTLYPNELKKMKSTL